MLCILELLYYHYNYYYYFRHRGRKTGPFRVECEFLKPTTMEHLYSFSLVGSLVLPSEHTCCLSPSPALVFCRIVRCRVQTSGTVGVLIFHRHHPHACFRRAKKAGSQWEVCGLASSPLPPRWPRAQRRNHIIRLSRAMGLPPVVAQALLLGARWNTELCVLCFCWAVRG